MASVKKLVKSYSCVECLKQQADWVNGIHEGIVTGELPEGIESELLVKRTRKN